MIGLVGKKIGMTQIFNKEGLVFPITIIKINKNRITQIKTIGIDSYQAIQVTAGKKKKSKLRKSELGHFLKFNVQPGDGLWEFKVSQVNNFQVNQILDINLFNSIKKVDVVGVSKGKGFAGTVKRWNFSMQDKTHGNSLSHRAPGSIGQNQTPGRVFKGKKMSGHLGNARVTIQNLKIMQIDSKNDLLFLKGSVPGAIGNYIVIKPAIKI